MDFNTETISLALSIGANVLAIPSAGIFLAKIKQYEPQIIEAFAQAEALKKKAKGMATIVKTVSAIVEDVELAEVDNVIDPVEAMRILTQVKDFVNSPEVKELIEEFNV